MQIGLNSSSFLEVKSRMQNALEWIKDIGIRVEHTRIQEYCYSIEILEKAYREDCLDDLNNTESMRTLTNAFYEAFEICRIHRHLSGLFTSENKSKLKRFVEGPVCFLDESTNTSSNLARNIGFELGVAADLVSGGFEVDLSSEADIVIKKLPFQMYFECKRPQKKESVNRNIRKAKKQLEKRYQRYNDPDNARGIVTLSVSRIVNPTFGGLVVDEPDEVGIGAMNILTELKEYYWQTFLDRRDSRTIGMLLVMNLPFLIKTRIMHGTGRFFYLFSPPLTNIERYTVKQIHTSMNENTS